MTIASLGSGQLSNYGRSLVARAMYERGKGFLGAAALVDQRDGHPFVVLHLLCQGIEIVLKAVLLANDYKQFKPQLRALGHDLPKSAAAVKEATGLHVFKGGVEQELQVLSNFYRQHLLRYAGAIDIFIDPKTIPSRRVFKRTAALLRYAERKKLFDEAA